MGSNPTPRTTTAPTKVLEFGLWLKTTKGNRINTIERKLRYLKQLNGTPEEMVKQILEKQWVDKSKSNALDAVCQYTEFLGSPIEKPAFRIYDNTEMYVPNPEMIRTIIYRVRKLELRTMITIAVETGASAGETHQLTWKNVNLQNRTITITGIKGHRTQTYPISDELATLLMQIPKTRDQIFSQKTSRHITDSIRDYRIRLAKETGNSDYLKIHFHTFRHYAISWKYFKTKDIVETQRFARHCNIQNTLKYVHIIKSWIKENEYDVVYANTKEEMSKYLSEGYTYITTTQWGQCLTKPKTLLS